MDDQLMTDEEVREYLGVSRPTLLSYRKNHGLPAYKVGSGKQGATRYYRSEVEAWVRSRALPDAAAE